MVFPVPLTSLDDPEWLSDLFLSIQLVGFFASCGVFESWILLGVIGFFTITLLSTTTVFSCVAGIAQPTGLDGFLLLAQLAQFGEHSACWVAEGREEMVSQWQIKALLSLAVQFMWDL